MKSTENPNPSEPEYDHEHPCPSDMCINLLRQIGYAIPEEADCCTCYERAQKRAGHPEG